MIELIWPGDYSSVKMSRFVSSIICLRSLEEMMWWWGLGEEDMVNDYD